MAKKKHENDPLHGGAVRLPRSRGALSGIILIVLGAWGALIPFIGPIFSFGYAPNKSWQWSTARGWLDVLPGAVVVLGALLLLLSANRIVTSFGGWLAVAGGVWFIIGVNCAQLFHIGSPGLPSGKSQGLKTLETLAFFDGIGALIVILAALALGRLSIRSVRDVRAAQNREFQAEAEQRREDDYAETRRQRLADENDQSRSDQDSDSAPPIQRYASRSDRKTQPVRETERGYSTTTSDTDAPAAMTDTTPSPNGATALDARDK